MLENSEYKKNAFTLVEVLVSIVIFSTIMGVAIGVFVSAMRIQRYSLASQELLDQTSYAVEYMSRFVRMAKKATDERWLADGINYSQSSESELKFINYREEFQKFYLTSGQVYQELDGESLALTSDNLEVTNLKFYFSGEQQPPTDYYQPRVTIFLEAQAKNSDPQPKVKLQTSISQRDLDLEE